VRVIEMFCGTEGGSALEIYGLYLCSFWEFEWKTSVAVMAKTVLFLFFI